MMVDNHIYTINQNAISLQHVSDEGGLTENVIIASSDYKVKEREIKPIYMIDTIMIYLKRGTWRTKEKKKILYF